jgi:MOSC domain-containing protein YiiM
MTAQLISLQVGLPQQLGTAGDDTPSHSPWTSGIVKSSVQGDVWLGVLNLAGDGQADLQHHGGLHKAICLYPVEHYPYWQATLHWDNVPYGAFGENFTTAGLLEDTICIGDSFRVGQAIVQVSQPRQPCWKLARRWGIKDLALQVQESGRTGWYFRVLQEGVVRAGETMTLLERPYPQWTVTTANVLMHQRKEDHEAIRALAACPLLSDNWRATFETRLARHDAGNAHSRL